MSSPFLAEVRMFGFNFPPKGWAQCNGQTLPISQNTALFSLLGNNYGGNGQSTFGLPNLQGASPITSGQAPGLSSYVEGQTGGAPSVTLLSSNLPAHNHAMAALSSGGNSATPSGNVPAQFGTRNTGLNYGSDATTTALATTALATTGGNQPHNNMQPYLAVNYCIALQGIFPARP